jgi:glycosyltransferase involved in cell wall biosynthesis
VHTARRIRPDVIYTSQQYLDAEIGFLLSKLLGVPHVLALHYQVGPWLGRTALTLIRRSRRLVAISEYVRQSAITHGADPGSIRVAHNSVHVEPFLNPTGGRAVRRELGIPAAAPLISSVGRLDPSKGHVELIRAFAGVVAVLPEARLLICGETFTREPYDLFLEDEAGQLGLKEHVIFAGYRSDIPAVLAASDVFCLPTHEEAFGMVFVEAMAAALPVVAFRAGAVPEIVLHDKTGFLAELHNVEELSTYLQQLLADRELARQMGAAGCERVRRHFIPAVRAPHWAQTVRSLL